MPGLYIHIPFCRKKCNYCDFTSFPKESHSRIPSYIEALGCEMKLHGHKPIDTVYVGGGTPSILETEQILSLFRSIRLSFNCSRLSEISAESNPESLTEKTLEAFRKAGVNRLSIGIQSFSSKRLSWLGRIHSPSDAVTAFDNARKTRFSNISIDLMYGFPDQTPREWQDDLEYAVSLNPEHISAYPLTIEPDTPFFNRDVRVQEDGQAAMYEYTMEFLERCGYIHYEISNWSRLGFECRHNVNYWNNGSYIGLGVSAASYLGDNRTKNTSELEKYIRSVTAGTAATEEFDRITDSTRLTEEAILKLRTRSGLPVSPEIEARFSSTIERFVSQELLEKCGSKVRLTRRGMLVANQVMKEFT